MSSEKGQTWFPGSNAGQKVAGAPEPEPTKGDLRRQEEAFRRSGFRPDFRPTPPGGYPYRTGDLLWDTRESIRGWERTEAPPLQWDSTTGRFHSFGARLGNTAQVVYQHRKI